MGHPPKSPLSTLLRRGVLRSPTLGKSPSTWCLPKPNEVLSWRKTALRYPLTRPRTVRSPSLKSVSPKHGCLLTTRLVLPPKCKCLTRTTCLSMRVRVSNPRTPKIATVVLSFTMMTMNKLVSTFAPVLRKLMKCTMRGRMKVAKIIASTF